MTTTTPMPDHVPPANEEMLASQVFRLLNVLIDGKARELVGTDVSIRYRCNQILQTESTSGYRENLRVSYERDKGDDAQVQLADIDSPLKSLVYLSGERERLTREINELQQIKLRLLNDYDFTHGDNRLQLQVFRPEMYAALIEAEAAEAAKGDVA